MRATRAVGVGVGAKQMSGVDPDGFGFCRDDYFRLEVVLGNVFTSSSGVFNGTTTDDAMIGESNVV